MNFYGFDCQADADLYVALCNAECVRREHGMSQQAPPAAGATRIVADTMPLAGWACDYDPMESIPEVWSNAGYHCSGDAASRAGQIG